MIQDNSPLPLGQMRVLDCCDRIGQSCGRFLADLGAEVILLEPEAGMTSRQRPPLHNGESLYFAVHNANKKSVVVDLQSGQGREQFLTLVKSADLLIDGGELTGRGISHEEVRAANPQLLLLSITDFGLKGPYKDFIATEAVHAAMGGFLSRSGIAGREPLLPPGEMSYETASIQAGWVALLAYWQRQKIGKGDLLDFSINDAVSQLMDPAIGATGSAAVGRTPIEMAPHGRPVVNRIPGEMPSLALLYPYYKCADGYVRICTLNPRQWMAMSDWLGPDHPLTDPKYAETAVRIFKIDIANALVADLVKDKTRVELVAEGQQRCIPIASVTKPVEVFNNEHYRERDLFTEVPFQKDKGMLPSGYLHMDNRRIGIRKLAPQLGENTLDVVKQIQPKVLACESAKLISHPLKGITVLDLGVIVAGGELGRLFADQGAAVIKLETKAYADGLRRSSDGNPVSMTFAQGSRGKKSFGLNLRSKRGMAIFKDLVKKSDVVISNFKPGTTESLGIDYQSLKEINPAIICAESSALGSMGPQAKTMGYGPLVRASTSLSTVWRYPDQEDGFGDGVTIYPDHFVARTSATAIMAKLIDREKSGIGGFVDLSQAECIINVMATEFLRESIEPGSMVPRGNRSEFDAPNSLFQCRGNDEWVAISVTNDQQWQALCDLTGNDDLKNNIGYVTAEGRVARREELEKIVSAWTCNFSPYEIMQACQESGVPAGNMLRLSEFLGNTHLRERGFFRTLNQPTAGRPLDTENAPVGSSELLPDPDITRAPARAEHTREIAKEYLGYSDLEVDALIEAGVLETGSPGDAGVMKQKIKTVLVSHATKAFLKFRAFREQSSG